MAVGNLIFTVLTALVTVKFIFAEENPLELGDFASDEVDGNENHKPPSKINDNEKTQERKMSLLSDSSNRAPCDFRQGRYSCLSCRKGVRCLSISAGIAFSCSDPQPYCNEGKCSDTPSSLCKSGFF